MNISPLPACLLQDIRDHYTWVQYLRSIIQDRQECERVESTVEFDEESIWKIIDSLHEEGESEEPESEESPENE